MLCLFTTINIISLSIEYTFNKKMFHILHIAQVTAITDSLEYKHLYCYIFRFKFIIDGHFSKHGI